MERMSRERKVDQRKLTATPSTVGVTFSVAACLDFSMNVSAFGLTCFSLGFFS